MHHGDKSSRAQILKKASDYISFMRKKNASHQREIEELKNQNGHLEVRHCCCRNISRMKGLYGQFSSDKKLYPTRGVFQQSVFHLHIYNFSSSFPGSDPRPGACQEHWPIRIAGRGARGQWAQLRGRHRRGCRRGRPGMIFSDYRERREISHVCIHFAENFKSVKEDAIFSLRYNFA